MKQFGLLLFALFLCCNNAKNELVIKKDYVLQHQEALLYVKDNGFNQSYYYLIDMSIPSGKNRFFVYNFDTKKIIDKALVTHGSCDVFDDNTSKWEVAKFDSRLDSHCTMLGKYKIGKRDYSSWGIKVKYWLHGQEKSNKTAVNRVVVLHSWSAVANQEIHPEVSPLSWGCPAVSDAFMKKIDVQLKQSKKPVLLWIIAK